MMSYINETDFVIENKELVYPEIITDGLQLYYDAKGKRDTDYHRDTMLDMSGNKNHGKLHNFAYEKHSGYKDGLVFDYIDDKLVRPELNGIDANNFTYQLNSNILAFTGDEVKTVKNGSVEVGGKNLFAISEVSVHSRLEKSENKLTFINNYANNTGIKVGSILEVGKEYTISFKVKLLSGDANQPGISGSIRFYDSSGESPVIQFGGRGTENISETFVLDSISESYVIYFYGSTTGVYEFKDIKIEKGNKATDWTPAPKDLIETTELKGNILGDMENIIDGLYKTEVLSGEEIYTDKADDSVVHVEMDGKSVGGGSGKNLCYKNTFTGTVHRTSETTHAVDKVIEHNIPISPNNTYTLSGIFPSKLGLTIFATTTKVDKNITGHNSMFGHVTGSGIGIQIINRKVPAGYNYVTITTGGSFNKSHHDVGTSLTWSNIQLEEGSTATAYEPPAPSPDYPIEIHSLNDFDVVSQKSEGGTIGGRNLVLDSNNIIMNQGTNSGLAVREEDYVSITPTDNGNVYANLRVKTSLDRVQGEVYTVSLEVNTLESTGLYWYPSNRKTFRGIIPNTNGEWAKVSHTYTQSGETVSGSVGFLVGFNQLTAGKEIRYRNLKLEKGNKATDWTPAPEDITESDNHPLIDKINLLLDEPLRSVGDVKDRLFRDSDGLWKVERKVNEYIFTGSESFGAHYLYGTFYSTGDSLHNDRIIGAKSNYLKSSTGLALVNGEKNAVGLADNSRAVRMSIVVDGTQLTDSTIKPWLTQKYNSGNPLIIQYLVKTPTTEILDQELQDKLNNLRSFEDSNYVYTVINDKTDILSDYVAENLKPTLHAKFLYNNWYKEDRVINNLMIYNRALTNEEMLQNYKTIKRRWGM